MSNIKKRNRKDFTKEQKKKRIRLDLNRVILDFYTSCLTSNTIDPSLTVTYISGFTESTGSEDIKH